MTSLIINRVNYILAEENMTLYMSKNDDLLFRMQLKNIKKILNCNTNHDFLAWAGELTEENYVYYSFIYPGENIFSYKLSKNSINYFKPKYVKEQLITFFSEFDFLVEPFPIGSDINVYERIDSYNEDWSTYCRYDFFISKNKKEIAFNIGSENTLISDRVQNYNGIERIKILDNEDNYIKRLKNIGQDNNNRIVANKEIRNFLGISSEKKKLSYKLLYSKLLDFYKGKLLLLNKDNFKIEAGGLKNVEQQDLFKVNIAENQMLFGKEKTDINAVTGLRDYGIYKPSPKAMDIKFIFIYENKDDANKLYLCLKNGLKHFPGLWSYVGIPPTLADFNLKYNNVNVLKEEFDDFLEEHLKENYYNNFFAIVIEPFSVQETQKNLNQDEPELYYYIKEKLLIKGISSQFINYKSIRSENFHYYLPNISIGILAKLGGIPWRLKTKKVDELVIGFNQKIIRNNNYIGSAVFFSNEGELGRTFGFAETDSEIALIRNLKNSIEQFIDQKEKAPERLVIHYYKPQSSIEKKSIEYLIQNELRLNLPFAIVEINDSKSQMDICFDKDFFMGMPESGTYVKINKSEYLLFNNTRYQKNPVRSVSEELPIKINIHFADTGGFSHKDLISQAYEFSRLYWKGLKQRSQPSTTIYAKLIADFAAHFNGILPNNEITYSTPWFL